MSYPLIILGAGASYDYSVKGMETSTSLAPLTNQLVDSQHIDESLLRQYPGSGSLLGDLVSKIRNKTKTFEQALTDHKAKTHGSLEMRKQFVALEFYLKDLFRNISISDSSVERKRMHEINNYRSLANRIYTYCGGEACIVTFNYDSLLERNIPRRFEMINDYVNDKIKIFKLHGSHNWSYLQRKNAILLSRNENINSFDFCMRNPGILDTVRENNHEPVHDREITQHPESDDFFHLPAIAIPLTGKDSYVCPPSHIATLESCLPRVDRVLIIGWKGGDPALVDLLAKYTDFRNSTIKLLVVSGNVSEAQFVVETMSEKLRFNNPEAYKGGFSDFMGDDLSETFFS